MSTETAYPVSSWHYRILTENALECIWTYDIRADKFTFISPAVFRLVGYTVDEAMQNKLSDIMPKDSLEKANAAIQLLLDRYEHGERREDFLLHVDDYTLICKNKAEKQVEITAKIIRSEESGALEILGITRDATRHKQLEYQLNQALANKGEMIQRLQDSEAVLKELARKLHQKNKILKSHATIDDLTGIYNRHYLNQKITDESDRCRRYHHPLSIVLFDIDLFKEINDTYGHHTGDQVLVAIANAVKKTIRRHDTFARWGGEEFLILMPHTFLSEATQAAEKLRQTLEALRHPGIDGPVTASFGVVEFMPGETEESWFRRVDHAMFRSKNEGRNRVTAITWEAVIPFVQIKLEWKREWECGNAMIDDQHKHLLTLGNRLLYSAFDDMQGKGTANLLEELITHIREHFESEERILREIAYPAADCHAKIHQTLLEHTAKLQEQYQEENLSSSSVFSFLLDEVIMGHLLKEDILYFPHIRNCGAPPQPPRQQDQNT